ncbi:MAG: class I SAM-dependent methyltransferase [Aquabacterium sp.]
MSASASSACKLKLPGQPAGGTAQARPLTVQVGPADAPRLARAALRLLQHLHHGALDLTLPGGQTQRCGHGDPVAAATIHDWRVFGMAARSGDIGFAEAFRDGLWDSPDPAAVLRLFAANREGLEALVYGRWWGTLLQRAQHWLNRNTRAGSRRNIAAHYDLGNPFYRLWLDPTMNYSAALFERGHGGDLAAAQRAKMVRALRQCGIRHGQRLLEVGIGWGSLAETAAGRFGARVTGVTLSKEQLAEARARLHQAGLDGHADLRLQDYRDIGDEPFDAIVSIEMFEAVGRQWWPDYFRMLRSKLKPGGRACIQSIVIRDDLFERYAAGTDFIQQYIFPGGLLPSTQVFEAQAASAGLKVVDRFGFGRDYAETLRRWRTSFTQHSDAVRGQGFDASFVRLWTFYLAYCEAAFDAGNTDVVQFTLEHA